MCVCSADNQLGGHIKPKVAVVSSMLLTVAKCIGQLAKLHLGAPRPMARQSFFRILNALLRTMLPVAMWHLVGHVSGQTFVRLLNHGL